MHSLVPRPSRFEARSGPPFLVTPETVVRVPAGNDEVGRIGQGLAAWIGHAAGPDPPRVESGIVAAGGGAIVLQLGEVAEEGTEAYELTIGADGVMIRGRRPAGVFYGVQTFRQLLPSYVEYQAARPHASRPIAAAAVHVADSPRFEWRGAMLDVARHFFTVDEVER